MTPAEIAEALGGATRAGNGYNCRCPVHDDAKASLNVAVDNDVLLIKCYAGCDQLAVLDALRARGLMNGYDRGCAFDFAIAALGKPSRIWTYRNATGARELLKVARYATPTGKEYRPWIPDGARWKCGAHPVPRPLYGLDLLAKHPTLPVLVTEGEKACDAARELVGTRHACTTWPGGANAADKADWTRLRGRAVTLWPDADAPGDKAMRTVAAKLAGIAASVAIVDPGEREKGWDLADAKAEGWTGEDVLTFIDEHSTNVGGDTAVDVGASLLDELYSLLRKFVAYPSDDATVAHALWIAHAHAMDAWESTPRLAFLSPEPGSGKTRALEITETLVPNPVEAINATPAYLFRKVADPEGLPTILFDEIDTLFGPRAKENEEVRGILNAGHRRGAMAGRCVVRGKTVETEELPAYCAVALAGLGNLPDTILSRSVIVRMRRRGPDEHVEPYRRRVHAPEGNALRDRLATWTRAVAAQLAVVPAMPDGVTDRSADVWEALLAIADAAGGNWPERARVAAVSLVSLTKAASPSLGVRLLADLRQIFGDAECVSTEALLQELCKMDEAPWSDLKGKAIDARRLANYLRPYGVSSKQVRIGAQTLKGYTREDLFDPWARYLGEAANGCETSETSVTDDDAEAYRRATRGE
jgi:hypothetical protein